MHFPTATCLSSVSLVDCLLPRVPRVYRVHGGIVCSLAVCGSWVEAWVLAQVGLLSFPPREGELNKPYSDATALLIDQEVGCMPAHCAQWPDLHVRQGVASCAPWRPSSQPLMSLLDTLFWRAASGVRDTVKHTSGYRAPLLSSAH